MTLICVPQLPSKATSSIKLCCHLLERDLAGSKAWVSIQTIAMFIIVTLLFKQSWETLKMLFLFFIIYQLVNKCRAARSRSTWASSWGAGCWCAHTSSYGSWQHGDEGGRNTCDRWRRKSCSAATRAPALLGALNMYDTNRLNTYLRQIILSQLYFWASCLREGSMMPPRRRSTRWRVDSAGRFVLKKVDSTLCILDCLHPTLKSTQGSFDILPFWIL